MEVWFEYQGNLVKEYPGFVYEVEIYKRDFNSWSLEESSYYTSTTTIKDLIPFMRYIYKDYQLFKYVTLVAAPSKWLKQNTMQVEIESSKEKRKRIKEKKELKKKQKNE